MAGRIFIAHSIRKIAEKIVIRTGNFYICKTKHLFFLKKLFRTALFGLLFGGALAQTLEFPEPEFIGQCLAIRIDNSTEQLAQESLAPRHRSSTGQKLFGIGKEHIDEMTLKGPRAYTDTVSKSVSGEG